MHSSRKVGLDSENGNFEPHEDVAPHLQVSAKQTLVHVRDSLTRRLGPVLRQQSVELVDSQPFGCALGEPLEAALGP